MLKILNIILYQNYITGVMKLKVVKAIFFKSMKDRIRIVNYYIARNYIVEVFQDEKFIYVESKGEIKNECKH